MKAVLLIAAILPATAFGALPCSIQLPEDTPASGLRALAKLSEAEAEKAALSVVKAKRKRVVSKELEIEQRCLVYSFDIKVSGKSGVEEVLVDAGDGKVLLIKHETPQEEAREMKKGTSK
jgi:hypothetical protein